MKNTFYIASAFAALLAIGCNKSEQPAGTPETPAKESGIVLYAQDINAIGSKTTTTEENGKFTVNWANGDQLAVYTVPAGTDPTTMTLAEWQASEPVRFKATESAAQDGSMKFVLDETESDASKLEAYKSRLEAFKERYVAGNLDWYAVYPGIMDAASHSGKGVVTFGVSNKSQSGNNNMDHLANQDVLFGKVLDTKEPVITMQHIGTLMEFAVTNASDTEFTVKSISITTPEVIVGEFRLHLTKETPLDKTDGFGLSKTYMLTVNDAEPIQRGKTARFYQILAPFTVASGKSVSITVDTDKGLWSKTMTATGNGLDFAAGAKSSANLNVDALEKVATKQVTLGFCNNEGGNIYTPLLSITGCETYTIADGTQNQRQIDIVAWHLTKITLGAPSYQFMPYPDVTKWAVRNGTSFKRAKITQSDFDGFTKYSAIVKAYKNATEGFDMFEIKENEDNYVFVKTASEQYAVIKIDKLNNKTLGVNKNKYESVTLTVKYLN